MMCGVWWKYHDFENNLLSMCLGILFKMSENQNSNKFVNKW